MRFTYLIKNSKLNLNFEASLENIDQLEQIFNENKPKIVINLAAQAGAKILNRKSFNIYSK